MKGATIQNLTVAFKQLAFKISPFPARPCPGTTRERYLEWGVGNQAGIKGRACFFFFFLIAVFLLEWSGLLGFSRTSFSINWGQDRFLALTAWALTCPGVPPFIGEAKTLSSNRSDYFSWGTADPCSDLWLSFDHVQVRKHPRFPVPSFTREKCPLKPRPLT